jgi:hypothetical protein
MISTSIWFRRFILSWERKQNISYSKQSCWGDCRKECFQIYSLLVPEQRSFPSEQEHLQKKRVEQSNYELSTDMFFSWQIENDSLWKRKSDANLNLMSKFAALSLSFSLEAEISLRFQEYSRNPFCSLLSFCGLDTNSWQEPRPENGLKKRRGWSAHTALTSESKRTVWCSSLRTVSWQFCRLFVFLGILVCGCQTKL